MNIKAFLFDDDRGVSPVIGVILMVAITVILAAVIAAFVLGLGDTNESAPSVTWDYEYNNDANELGTVNITMTGGESFDPARVSFAGENLNVTGTYDSSASGGSTSDDAPDTTTQSWEDIVGIGAADFGDDVDTVRAGNTVVLGLAVDTVSSSPNNNVGTIDTDFELRIIFESEDGGTSSEIGGTTGSDA